MTTLVVAWWLNLGVNAIAGFVALALGMRTQWNPNLHHAIKRGKLTIIGWALFIFSCSILLSVTFLLDEGTALRADAVISYWARWAWYIPMSLGLFFIIALWSWQGHFSMMSGLGLVALGAVAQLFAVLSVSIAHWVWFLLSLLYCVVLTIVVVAFKRRMDYWAWVGIVLFLIPAMIRPIIMGLGYHLGGVLSLEVETWVYTFFDCLVFTLYPFLLWYKFCPIPIDLIEHPEINGMKYAYCPPKQKQCNKERVVQRRDCSQPAYQPLPCATQPQTQDPCDIGGGGGGIGGMWNRARNMMMYNARPSDTLSCSSGQCERTIPSYMPGAEVQAFNTHSSSGISADPDYPFQQQWNLVPSMAQQGSIP